MKTRLSGIKTLTRQDWMAWGLMCVTLLVVVPLALWTFGVHLGIWYTLIVVFIGNVVMTARIHRRSVSDPKRIRR